MVCPSCNCESTFFVTKKTLEDNDVKICDNCNSHLCKIAEVYRLIKETNGNPATLRKVVQKGYDEHIIGAEKLYFNIVLAEFNKIDLEYFEGYFG